MLKKIITVLFETYTGTRQEITQHHTRRFKRLKDFQNMGPKMQHLWTPSKDPYWLYENWKPPAPALRL